MAATWLAQGTASRSTNRTAAKSAQWAAEHGGRTAASPREAAAGAAAVFACVGNDDDLRSVCWARRRAGGHGARSGSSITPPHRPQSRANSMPASESAWPGVRRCAGIGRPGRGSQRHLTIMCGGDVAPFEAIRPVAMAYAKAVTLIGASGAGQLAKMVNQICVTGVVQGAGPEAIASARRRAWT